MDRTAPPRLNGAAPATPAQAELPLVLPAATRHVLPLSVVARHPRAGRPWTVAEISTLRIDLPRIGLERTARGLLRPREEVKAEADRRGLIETQSDRRRRQELEAAGLSPAPSTNRPRRGRATQWSASEDAAIKARYPAEGAYKLACDPIFNARTAKAIEIRASRLQVRTAVISEKRSRSARMPNWSEAEDQLIGSAKSLADIPALLPQLAGRSVEAASQRWYAKRVAGRTLHPWSEEDDQLLEELYPTHRPKDVALMLGRSYAAVTNRAAARGLTREVRPWTAVDDAVLRVNFSDMPLDLLARQLGRTPAACQIRAANLGLVSVISR